MPSIHALPNSIPAVVARMSDRASIRAIADERRRHEESLPKADPVILDVKCEVVSVGPLGGGARSVHVLDRDGRLLHLVLDVKDDALADRLKSIRARGLAAEILYEEPKTPRHLRMVAGRIVEVC